MESSKLKLGAIRGRPREEGWEEGKRCDKGLAHQPLPPLLRWSNAVAGVLGVDAPHLVPEKITRAAARLAGLPPTFPAHVGDALEILCRSLRDEVELHWPGRVNVWNLMVTGLAEFLLVEDTFRRAPELENGELIPPLIVTGLPRSGTTFLHRMLADVDDAAGVAFHRHLLPTQGPLRSRFAGEAMFLPWRSASRPYHLDAIHYVRPALPDECNLGMRLGLRSMIFWSMVPIYSYLDWLLDQDLREAYRFYRRVLLLHQAHAPGRRLTLKCPQHLGWLPALHEALPEALIVQTHREPREAVPSDSVLILTLQAISTPARDWRRTVAANHRRIASYASRSVDFAATAAGRAVCHVDYRDLVRDPIAVTRAIHARFGLAFTEREEARIAAFASTNRQNKYGRSRYSLEQLELDGEDIDRTFRSYSERFLRGAPQESFT